MRSLIFDTGPIISLTLNELLWLFRELKKKYPGKFCITESTKKEIIDKPLSGKKFRFEAIRVKDLINEKILNICNQNEIETFGEKLMKLGNSSYYVKDQSLKIVQRAEMDSVAATIISKADALVIEERVTRSLIEDPNSLQKHLSRKLHMKVKVNKKNLDEFRKLTKSVKIIRSAELVTIGYELGLLNKYVEADGFVDEEMSKKLLGSALWALKLSGCAITKRDIERIVKFETKKLK